MAEPIVIHAETCNGDTYEIRYYRASDYDALAAENAALRKDVERLARQCDALVTIIRNVHGALLDDRITAAMGEKP